MFLNNQLNEEQHEAVNTIDGPLLVIAGAGSGKTRVVTFRIAKLIEIGIPPSEILALTFTNKAAQEMKERVRNLTQHQVLVCTFHSLGAKILRESIHALGYGRDFLIYDDEDSDKVLRACMAELEIRDKQLDPKTFRNLISHAKNQLKMPEDVDTLGLPNNLQTLFPKVYALYQSKLQQYNALDFDDLLFLTVRLLKNHPDVLEMYQKRWSYLLIDEYQDTNQSQYLLVKLLAQKHHNVFVVGDPDQSIYSWRGANIKNILNFDSDFSGAKSIRLEKNYRSYGHILDAANGLIEHNQDRLEKKLWSDLGPGEKVKFFSADDERMEAAFVAEKICKHHEADNIPLNQMVVFYRTNAQSRVFEDYFLYKRIPYVIVGGISFYQRREIKDILAFLRMVHSGSDFLAFSRTINLPKRGIGEATIEKLHMGAAKEGRTLFSYLEALVDGSPLSHPIKLPEKQKEGLKDYVHIVRALKEVQRDCSLRELVKAAIDQSHYLSLLKLDPESFDDRQRNLDGLISKAIEWETTSENPTLEAFLEELSLKSSLDEADISKDRVNLMTVHNGKGLEFPVTFLVGMEQDLFPHANSREKPDALEEERRLCYVGMTRAKQYLYLTEAKYRYMWGKGRDQRTSCFIREIPYAHIEKVRRSIDIQKKTREEPFIDEMDQTVPEILDEAPLAAGEAVFHKEFGIGIVRQAAVQGSLGMIYKILFSKDQKERSIVAKYAHLKRL